MPRPSGRSTRTHQYKSPTYRDLLARLAANVKRLRDARGWTQEEAAHQCGMTTAFFQSVEGETSNATATTLARLADGLGADVSDLLTRADPLPRRRPGRPAKGSKEPIAKTASAGTTPATDTTQQPTAPTRASDEKPDAPPHERGDAPTRE